MTCRLCSNSLYSTPVLELNGMPESAQGFVHAPEQAGKLADLKIRQCSACGLIQLDASPVDYYRSVITSANWSPEMLAFRRSQALDFVNKHHLHGSKVIEIGCATGHFLDLLTEAGAIAQGLEFSESSVAKGQEKGRSIVRGYITEAPLLNPPYSAAVCINFLEHAPQPLEFLKSIHAILNGDGVALIEVPSLDKVIKNQRYYDFIRDHLSYFSESSLNHALNSAGFEVLEIKDVWHSDDLCATVRKRSYANFSNWLTSNPVINEFKSLIESKPSSRCVIWGASHQALSLIALAKPTTIKFIVDSSPAKQNLYEPTLGLPIFSPEKISCSEIDLVIIMAAGYSDEVHNQLRNTIGFTGAAAILRENSFQLIPPTL